MIQEHDYDKYPELTNKQLETEQFNSPHPQLTSDFNAVVVKVSDGDTVSLTTSSRDFVFPLRFLDIDAPELKDGGDITKQWLKTKIEGESVEIRIDPNNRVGKYGRLLGRVFYHGMDVGQEELYLGLAVPFGKKKEGELISLGKMFSLSQWF